MRAQRGWAVVVLAAFGALLAIACSDALPEAPQQPVEQGASPSQSVSAVSLGDDRSELCEGLPTQTILVTPASFDEDERMVRVITAPSGQCTTTFTLTFDHDPRAGGACVIEYPGPIIPYIGERGAAYLGDCDWFRAQPGAVISSVSNVADASGCQGVDSLMLSVNAESFNERGRVDAVVFVPETRCYVFLSAAQDPERAEPFQFAPGQECVLRHSRTPQGDCEGIAFWSGRGRGGVQTQADAEAAVTLQRLD